MDIGDRVDAVKELLYGFGPPSEIGQEPYDEIERYLHEMRHQSYVVEISQEEWEEGAKAIRERQRRERMADCERVIIDTLGTFAITPKERTKLVWALMDTFQGWKDHDW